MRPYNDRILITVTLLDFIAPVATRFVTKYEPKRIKGASQGNQNGAKR